MFSTIPREMSCRPRWATGRAVSQSGARMMPSGYLEYSLDLDRGICGQRSYADGGAGMAALVAEYRNHQVGGAVQHLRPVEEIGSRIDEAAETHHARHLVEIADGSLHLRHQVDGATSCGGLALLDGDAGAELALGDQLALRIEADLTRNEQQVSGADEADIVRHGAGGFVQGDAQ